MVFNRKKRALQRQSLRKIAIWRETEDVAHDTHETCAFHEMLEAAPSAFAQNAVLNCCHLCNQYVSPFKIQAGEPPKAQITNPTNEAVQTTLASFFNLSGSKFITEENKEDQMVVKTDDKCPECMKVACQSCREQCSQCARELCKACLQLYECEESLELVCEACSQ